jgi:hypothetical protein
MELHTRRHVISALLALVVMSGCGTAAGVGGERVHRFERAKHATAADTLADPIVVRQPLSATKHAQLLAWMNDWRACMADRGVPLPPPHVYPRHVSIDVAAVDGYLKPGSGTPPAPSPFMRKSMSCVGSLGGTPATFLRTGGIVDVFEGTCAVQGSTKTKPDGQ